MDRRRGNDSALNDHDRLSCVVAAVVPISLIVSNSDLAIKVRPEPSSAMPLPIPPLTVPAALPQTHTPTPTPCPKHPLPSQLPSVLLRVVHSPQALRLPAVRS